LHQKKNISMENRCYESGAASMSTYQIAQHVEASTLVELLRWRALYQPERHAYSFIRQERMDDARLTYGELDRQARIIGAALQARGAVGKPVLLLHPPGLEYVAAFFGCLYAGAIAVPAYPPHSARTMPRIQAIVLDSRTDIVLATHDTLADLQHGFAQMPELAHMHWMATDRLDDCQATAWREPEITGISLAFLQYTSGSTGMPKGVMVTHNNLLHNLGMISRHCTQTPDSHMVSWLPPYHDLGLVCGILFPFYDGFPATLMSPMAFLQRPLRWLQAISSTRATMSLAPNFAYDLCCRKVTAEQRATLDLSNWEIAANGGEPARKETMDRFAATFGACGYRHGTFYPGYGMAESTLILATNKKQAVPLAPFFSLQALQHNGVIEIDPDDDDAKAITGYPEMAPDQKIIIVNPETRLQCAPDQIGEIWAAGPSIAQGYWGKPKETLHTFHAYVADTGEGPFLRTGDLGFMQDGALFVAGRSKDMIIMRGQNHYPQDIELTVERSHPAIRPGCCVAFSVDITGSEQLVVLAEIDPRYSPCHDPAGVAVEKSISHKSLSPQEVIKALRAAVAEEHELQIHHLMLLKAGSILKTSSGKLQRRACRSEFLAERLRAWDE
jgi:acyl-CoA synthetase (AMP-forming)/AMP-acid ligase II